MVIPILAAIDPRQRATGTHFENVAEELLNGILCHYEPPISEYSQYKAAKEVRENPEQYSFQHVKKSQSILRTSRLYRKRQAEHRQHVQDITPPPPPPTPKKNVRWRDEHNRKGIEGNIEGCATNHCDFLGFSRKGGDGLTDSLSPSAQGSSPKKSVDNMKPHPIMKRVPTPSARAPLNDSRSSKKKKLYDDEGHSLADSESDPPVVAPPPPTGLSQLRKMAMDLDDMYEPETYVQTKKNRPKRSATPRRPREQDQVDLHRSQSQGSVATPIKNHYDVPQQFDAEEKSSGLDQNEMKVDKRDSNDKTMGDENLLLERGGSRQLTISPSKRSEVYSDLTMDPAIAARRYRTPSPANTSKDIEANTGHQEPIVHPKISIEPRESASTSVDTKRLGAVLESRAKLKGSTVYDIHGNIVRQSPTHPVKVSSKETIEKEPSKNSMKDIQLNKGNVEKSPEQQRSMNTIDSAAKGANEMSIDTKHKKTNNSTKREPTPRMSMEPPILADIDNEVNARNGPLPPTPRRKDQGRKSSAERQIDREERRKEKIIRERLARSRQDLDNRKKSTPFASKTRQTSGSTTVATDAEIREEMSIALETVRQPRMSHPSPVSNSDSENQPIQANLTSQPSSLSNNSSVLSDAKESQPIKKDHTVSSHMHAHQAVSASSNSTRGKKLWKGMKKTIGRVKKIVNDIDEDRLQNQPNVLRDRR